MNSVRLPSVAGTFYPDNQPELQTLVDEYLDSASAIKEKPGEKLKALIVPHAGYPYSGPVAGSGYQSLRQNKGKLNRIWLIGPSHHHYFRGLATSSYDSWQTPLGKVGIDKLVLTLVKKYPALFSANNSAHRDEHSLEVQLPFLQQALGQFTIIPLLTGEIDPLSTAKIINSEINPQDLIIISSDLSHYLKYNQAKGSDKKTVDSILGLKDNLLVGEQACGINGVKLVIELAKINKWRPVLIDYRNSGDTAGDKDRVVGYASIGFWG